MAITKQQIDTVVTVTSNMQVTVNHINKLASTIQGLMANNWVSKTTIGSLLDGGGITVNSTVSAADQTTVLNQYATLKAQLVTLFNQLP